MNAHRTLARTTRGVAILLPLLLAGCSRDRAEQDQKLAPSSVALGMPAAEAVGGVAMDMAATAPPPDMPVPAPSGAIGSGPRVLIRNVSITMVVESVDSAGARIERAVASRGGFLASSSAEARGGFPYRDLAVRVPVGQLDAFLADVRRLAVRIDRESQGVQDVTAQVVDVEARLKTLRATEVELLALLSESRARGQKAEDIMAIHRELTSIRTQIEQYDAQRQSLRDLAAMSSVDLHLIPDAATGPLQPHGWRPGESLRRNLRVLVGTFQGLGDFVIWLFVVALPIVLVVGIVGALVLRGLGALLKRLRRGGSHGA